jgi:hypothetical protein
LDRERKVDLKIEIKKEKQGIFIISLADQFKSIKEEVLGKKIPNLSKSKVLGRMAHFIYLSLWWW